MILKAVLKGYEYPLNKHHAHEMTSHPIIPNYFFDKVLQTFTLGDLLI